MKKIKAIIHHIFLIPALVLLYIQVKRLGNKIRLFCFFPFYQTGGSERVHADIIQSISSDLTKNQLVIFLTKNSKSNTYKDFFYKHSSCFEVHSLERSRFKPLLLRLLANAISRSSNPVVFGANATLLFDLIPFLPDHVKIIDLTHSFVPEAMNPVEVRSLPYLNRLTKRIVIHENVKLDYQKLYQQAGITDQKWLDHIEVVHNKVGFPRWNIQHKVYAVPPLKVLFVGRNSPEKRIGLIGKIAHILRNDAIQFTLVGGRVADSVAEKHRPYIDFAGEITAPAQLTELYKSHHVILLTSRREGLPLVLMEGMAHGAVPVTTRVGGIGYHVLHLRNGCLIENHEDEEQIVQEMVVCLRQLSEQPEFLKTLGKAAQDSIFQEFSDEQFTQKWQNLLLHP